MQLYMRPKSPFWQCACSVGGKQLRTSTKEESLARAKDVARDWYLGLLGKYQAGELKTGTTFRKASEYFLNEYEIITEGERNADYVASHGMRLRVHLLPFFGDKVVTEITPGLVQEYRVHRMTSRKDPKTCEPLRDPKTGEPLRDPKTNRILKDHRTGVAKRPSRTTLHHEIITLRHVLKAANRHGWLPYLPDLSAPYKTSGKISHRAWFSPEEYKALYAATRERAKNPIKERWRKECEDLHDYVLFMVNTGLRPDEAGRIEFRDVAIVTDEATGERILEIEVRGKRGVGYCKSMPGAVLPFQRVVKRYALQPKDRVFGLPQRELINKILEDLDLKFDREGNRRTAYSLRHTYISMRLMEGADIYQVAKNCRTSVEMIEKYYASHIKNMIDASAINVRRSAPSLKTKSATRRPTNLNS
ncbi:site-specific integrase [Phenylobacterium sp.]|uniref:site-specific integrase n=1 Tax=Phenylobacterium sp. TaxID=1871053 RepID=UPI002717BC9C|nr:site-specific integrase [Phenylobacterium sp.]MDO8381029.1 site-specific integrase [Phenylobacterium sp.]